MEQWNCTPCCSVFIFDFLYVISLYQDDKYYLQPSQKQYSDVKSMMPWFSHFNDSLENTTLLSKAAFIFDIMANSTQARNSNLS